MADVRSLLRAERASRRITHPNAVYTNDNKLQCSLCEIPIKSETAWQSHLHSTDHVLRASRQQDAADTRASATASKKRKAATEDPPPETDRKKVRSTAAPTRPREDDDVDRLSGLASIARGHATHEQIPSSENDASVTSLASARLVEQQAVDEAELAAFERELAAMERPAGSAIQLSALNSTATISAAPMTAEEIAAQAREEQSAQRGKRDVEIEAEREEAMGSLEEEFGVMEGLEERVRRLRERREGLRRGVVGGGRGGGVVEGEEEARGEGLLSDGVAAAEMDAKVDGEARDGDADEDEEDEGDDVDDGWGFGAS